MFTKHTVFPCFSMSISMSQRGDTIQILHAVFLKRAVFFCIPLLLTATHITSISATTQTYHRQPRILGGNEAQPHEFPYMVSLYRDIKPHHYCGGAIVNEKWVLTAAHCQLPSNKRLLVKAGKHSLSTLEDSEQVLDVTQVVVHEKYRRTFDGDDLALLKLNKPLIFNKYVKPVALSERGTEFIGPMVFSGWGRIKNHRWSDKLQKATLFIIDTEVCRKIDSRVSNEPSVVIADKMMCTGPITGEISLCPGDSGGPLVKRRNSETILVGVASFILDHCGSVISASVYTKVSYYVDWIENTMIRN